jgi:hypothetical protein
MIIENKVLYNFSRLAKQSGHDSLYIEGYHGGVNLYAFDGYTLYKTSIAGDNRREFYFSCAGWTDRTGNYDLKNAKSDGIAKKSIDNFRKGFLAVNITEFLINGKEFRQAVKMMDAINIGEKRHEIVLSFHNGYLNMASFANFEDEYAVYEEVMEVDGIEGSAFLDRKHLDGIKAKDMLKIGVAKVDNRMVFTFSNGEIEAIMAVRTIEDTARFLEAFGYEYKPIQAIEAIEQPEPLYAPPTMQEVLEADQETPSAFIDHKKEVAEYLDASRKKDHTEKAKRTPRKRAPKLRILRKENGAFTGWTANRLGTRQTKVLHF